MKKCCLLLSLILFSIITGCATKPTLVGPPRPEDLKKIAHRVTPLGTHPSSNIVSENLWQKFQNQLNLKQYIDHPKTQNMRNQVVKIKQLNHLTEDRQHLLAYVLDETKERRLPAELAVIPLVESAFRPTARAPGATVGLWQFTSGTARNFGVPVNKEGDARIDVQISTKAALDYLEYLNRMFKGDWLLTLAAYNAGEGRVMQAIRRNERAGKPVDFWSLDLPSITQDYVPKIIALSSLIAEQNYPDSRLGSGEEKGLTSIKTRSGLDLSWAAERAGISLDQLYFFNPTLPKKGPTRKNRELLIPQTAEEQFRSALKDFKPVPIPPKEDKSAVAQGNAKAISQKQQKKKNQTIVAKKTKTNTKVAAKSKNTSAVKATTRATTKATQKSSTKTPVVKPETKKAVGSKKVASKPASKAEVQSTNKTSKKSAGKK